MKSNWGCHLIFYNKKKKNKSTLLATHYHLFVWEWSCNRSLDPEFGSSIQNTLASWLLNRIVEPICDHAFKRHINNQNISTQLRYIILACEIWTPFFSFHSSNPLPSLDLMNDQGHYLRIILNTLVRVCVPSELAWGILLRVWRAQWKRQ